MVVIDHTLDLELEKKQQSKKVVIKTLYLVASRRRVSFSIEEKKIPLQIRKMRISEYTTAIYGAD